MKSKLFTITFLIIAINSQAQNPIGIGLKGGYGSFSQDYQFKQPPGTVFAAGPDDYSYNVYHFGAFSLIPLSKRFTFQPELLYSEKGSYIKSAPLANFQLHYIDLPLLMRINFGAFSIYSGPQFGFLAKAENGLGDDIKDGFKNTSISIVYGFQVDFGFGLIIGGRFDKGVSDISNVEEGDLFETKDGIKNQGVQAYIGWQLFKLNK
ncbi:porin family protein [Fulvivirga lutea]|uniref:PorT family protein n=1 Tax=Fulvivirga lutea TaxID=2810512 RepID=A0A974WGH9_9BACT|nr:porin family protein [Fulvivirga lutea]QSE96757.1 PorT family protein [Fulvivirga lutea]